MRLIKNLGFFGKLPGYGDFIHRGLTTSFISIWDDWLQSFVSGSKERLGEKWLDIYLTSPIWRFVFSPGVIDQHQWAGVVLPSVDRVGRYYPFSVVAQIDANASAIDFIDLQKQWYEGIEALCLDALEEDLDIDQLFTAMAEIKLRSARFPTNSRRKSLEAGLAIDSELEELEPIAIYPQMLDTLITHSLSCHSLWATKGSERVKPAILLTQVLPTHAQIAAMLDGNWEPWGWTQPYK